MKVRMFYDKSEIFCTNLSILFRPITIQDQIKAKSTQIIFQVLISIFLLVFFSENLILNCRAAAGVCVLRLNN